MVKLTQKDKQEIKSLLSLFPNKIDVEIKRSVGGGFVAEILTFPGCITEADTFSELIGMVNDCIRTCLEIPKKYISYMPEYIPPIGVAQRLGIFPLCLTARPLKFVQIQSAIPTR